MESVPDPAVRKSVLVADDDPALRRLLRIMLESEAYLVLEADDGEHAWELIGQYRPALVILDVCMPGRSGVQVTRAIRADPALRGTRVILLTGRTEPAQAAEAILAGADLYLTKPFSPLELLRSVADALQTR
jgi:CheY-like chemotaxis protein